MVHPCVSSAPANRKAATINLHPGPEYADSERRFQGIPGLERAPGGRLWALWYGGMDDEVIGNYVLAVTSGDEGHTWSGPRLVVEPPDDSRAFDPCLWVDPKGRLWLFWAQLYMGTDGWCGVWAICTEDPDAEQPQWSTPRLLGDGIMMNKPTVLSTGEWLLPASVWRFEGERCDPETLRGANVLVSQDEGETWSLLGQAQTPAPLFDEHMIIERRDGSLWMLIRTEGGIAESVSLDRGRTWSYGSPSALEHTSSRFFIRRLRSGRLLLVKHSPPGPPARSHLTAYLSDDDGASWVGGLVLDERDRISYPDGVEGPDGTIYIIYDYARYWEKQILMAVFTEEDVLAGRWGSPQARSRVVVNQATGKNRRY